MKNHSPAPIVRSCRATSSHPDRRRTSRRRLRTPRQRAPATPAATARSDPDGPCTARPTRPGSFTRIGAQATVALNGEGANQSLSNDSRTVAEIEFRVPVEPRLRVCHADCELAGVAPLDVLRGSIGDPDDRARFVLRVLFDLDDKCRPVLRPGYPHLVFRKPALNDVALLKFVQSPRTRRRSARWDSTLRQQEGRVRLERAHALLRRLRGRREGDCRDADATGA